MGEVLFLIEFSSFLNIAHLFGDDIKKAAEEYSAKLEEAFNSGDDVATAMQEALEELADYDKDRDGYYQHAPEYVERAWRIPGRRMNIVVWDNGNGDYTPMGVEVYADSGSLRLAKAR